MAFVCEIKKKWVKITFVNIESPKRLRLVCKTFGEEGYHNVKITVKHDRILSLIMQTVNQWLIVVKLIAHS